ncbi:MAG: arsenite S-adenosylmethyltransferase, partial [Desulfobulbaceae bacterium]
MKGEKEEQIRQKVREHYGKVATGGKGCGCEPQSSGTCCSPNQAAGDQAGALMGYTSTDLESIVEGANMNLGCGNPIAIAALQP